MKHLLTAALALSPVAALAHGGVDHMHPHGSEYWIAAVIVIGAAGAAYLVTRR